MSKTTWIAISGAIWFIVGMGLLVLGLNFIVLKARMDPMETTSLIARLSPLAGGREQAGMALIIIGLIVGFIKGRFVLVKTVQRVVHRIVSLKPPISIGQVYSKGYVLLILGMILLGMSMKWLKIPQEIRGTIDVAIGSALINGAMAYFRSAFSVNKQLEKQK